MQEEKEKRLIVKISLNIKLQSLLFMKDKNINLELQKQISWF